jgi:hypothetical protein
MTAANAAAMSASTAVMPVPTARRHRPGLALALAAAVMVLHGGLMVTLAPALPPRWGVDAQGQSRATAVQVRTVQQASTEGVAAPQAGPPTPLPARRPPAPRAARAAAALLAVRAAGPAPARLAPPAAPSAALPVDAVAAALDTSAEPAAFVEPVDRSSGAAEAPPVYATRIPAPVHLRYALRYNGQAGEATLVWRHDGVRYQLALEGLGATQALVQQASQGGFDHAGLAPERFTDRRRGGRQQAANFRRDIGRIGFSGPAVDYPAWPGAQDRLSWLPQFVAIRAAATLAAPAGEAGRSTTSLFVVDARGAAALWHFQPDGEAWLATALGPRPTERWRREPPRPEGLRVEAWLDAARGHWPLQLRFTALRSGDVFELRLLDEPGGSP